MRFRNILVLMFALFLVVGTGLVYAGESTLNPCNGQVFGSLKCNSEGVFSSPGAQVVFPFDGGGISYGYGGFEDFIAKVGGNSAQGVLPGGNAGVQKVSVGWTHSLFLKNGKVYCAGNNSTICPTSGDTPIPGLDNIVDIAAGDRKSYALKSDGTVWAWGYDLYGINPSNPGSIMTTSTPMQILGVPSTVTKIFSGGPTSDNLFMVTSNNKIYVNGFMPVYLSQGSYGVLAGSFQKSIKKIVGGYQHAIALFEDGTVAGYGLNNFCQFGNGGTSANGSFTFNVAPGISGVIDVATTDNNTALLLSSGEIYVFGKNIYGSLGLGNPDTGYSQCTPAKIESLSEPVVTINGTESFPRYMLVTNQGKVYGFGFNVGNAPVRLTAYETLINKGYFVINTNLYGHLLKIETTQTVSASTDITYLLSPNGTTWYKYDSSSSSWVTVQIPANLNTLTPIGMTKEELESLSVSFYDSLFSNSNKIYIAGIITIPNSSVSQIKVTSVNLNAGTVSGNSIVEYGNSVTYSTDMSTDYGTLNITAELNGNTIRNGRNVTIEFNELGQQTVSFRGCLQEYPDICVTSTKTVEVFPALSISINCPTTAGLGETVQCTGNISTAPENNGYPIEITWYPSSGLRITETNNTNQVDVKAISYGSQTVKVKAVFLDNPSVFKEATATINVPEPTVTGHIVCPAEGYMGQVVKCDLEYTSSIEGLSVQWLASVVFTEGNSANVKLSRGTNTITARLVLEGTSFMKTFSTQVYGRIPPQPVVSIVVNEGSGKATFVNFPVKINGVIRCPEGNTCSYQWYLNDEPMNVTELEFQKTFVSTGKQTIKLEAWVDGIEERNLVTTRAESQIYVMEYPNLRMYGLVEPKYASAGDTLVLKAVVANRDQVISELPIIVTWQLPDGSTLNGNEVQYTVTESDVDLNYPVKKNIKFTYQYEGFPESIKTGEVIVTLLPPYRMPDVDIRLYTPAEGPVPHAVVAAPRFLQQFLPGYRYNITYDWELIGTDITGNKKYFYGDITVPGEYTLRLTVGDGLGNVIEKEIPIRATDPLPWNVDFKIYRSNKYNVAPLNLLIKPVLYGGHPRDRVIQYKWTVDGSEISDKTILALRLEDPGTYTVNFTGLTKYGNVVEGETTIEVNPNEPPTCSLSSRTFTGTKTLYVSANCRDPDGIITAYYWSINGGEETKGGSRISLRYDEAGGPITVTLRVVDSGENNVEVTETFTIP